MVVKYISGDVASPMSVTSQPPASAPSMNAPLSAGVCGRRSPPTIMLVPPRRFSQVRPGLPDQPRDGRSQVGAVRLGQTSNVVGAEHVRIDGWSSGRRAVCHVRLPSAPAPHSLEMVAGK